MLRGAFDYIKTNESRILLILTLWHTELRINEPNVKLPGAVEPLEDVGPLQREIHTSAQCEVLEDSY